MSHPQGFWKDPPLKNFKTQIVCSCIYERAQNIQKVADNKKMPYQISYKTAWFWWIWLELKWAKCDSS